MKASTALPEGYHLLDSTDTTLLIGIDISYRSGRNRPESRVTHNGRNYRWTETEKMTPEDRLKYYLLRTYTILPSKEEMQAKGDAFATELKALLEKHNVTIMWTCGDGSDTHGIYDENMVIQDNNTNDNLIEIYGSCIGISDL